MPNHYPSIIPLLTWNFLKSLVFQLNYSVMCGCSTHGGKIPPLRGKESFSVTLKKLNSLNKWSCFTLRSIIMMMMGSKKLCLLVLVFNACFCFCQKWVKKKKEKDDHNFNNCYTKIALNNCIAMPKNLHLTFKWWLLKFSIKVFKSSVYQLYIQPTNKIIIRVFFFFFFYMKFIQTTC